MEDLSTERTSVNNGKQLIPNPSTGTTRLLVSVVVFPTLALASLPLLASLKIHCCLSVLLSALLSGYTA